MYRITKTNFPASPPPLSRTENKCTRFLSLVFPWRLETNSIHCFQSACILSSTVLLPIVIVKFEISMKIGNQQYPLLPKCLYPEQHCPFSHCDCESYLCKNLADTERGLWASLPMMTNSTSKIYRLQSAVVPLTHCFVHCYLPIVLITPRNLMKICFLIPAMFGNQFSVRQLFYLCRRKGK